jgi:dTDP-4-dehydrorhamnose reductase
MLGSAVRRSLAECAGWCVDSTQRRDPSASDYMDILEMPREQLVGILQRRYDYIINCVGILKPAVKEQDTKSLCRAIRVNALFPHEVAAIASESRIFHVSTDGVFSGNLGRPYLETDPTDCPDVYGKTKVLGECPAPNVINIRCSIVGRDPTGAKGLIEWVLRSPESSELTGFDDQHWNGVTTLQFAELCRRIIVSARFDEIRRESGLHHFCPNPPTTKYDLLCCIRDTAARNIVIRRGQSGAGNERILASDYSGLSAIYPEQHDWNAVIRDALVG